MYSRKSLFLNGAGILVSRVAAMLITFLATPIIISELGIGGYGAWEFILSLAVICSILQTSVAASLLWMISTAFGAADIASAQKYVRMATFFSLTAFSIVTPIIWIFKKPIAQLFSLSQYLQEESLWLLPCLVGLTLLSSVNEIMNSFISGFQRSGVAALAQAASVIIGNTFMVALVIAGFAHIGLLIGSALTMMIAFCVLFLVSRRIAPSFTVRPLLPSRRVIRKCAPFTAFTIVGVLASMSREQADKLFIAATASSAWVGYYGIASRLANLVMVVCTFLYVPTLAAVGGLSSNPDSSKLNRVYGDVCTMTIASVGLAVVILGSLSDRLTMLWIGRSIPEVESILYVMLGGIALAAMLTAGGTAICKGLGILHIELRYIVLSLALNAAIKILLIPMFGAIGSVIASFASWGLASVAFMFMFHRATGIATGPSFRIAGAIAIALICIALARYISGMVPLGTNRFDQVVPIAIIATGVTGFYVALAMVTGVIPRETVRSLLGKYKVMTARK
ncbi:Membrane protein involved in the export of O-antigen and teichoic acid [Porphyrobacter sp. LM 6]|nr:Membrane protein involved in the export of O-antigen and teichoic acid [Porphyrobacter sp. LM 6]